MQKFSNDIEAANALAESYKKLKTEIARVIIGQDDVVRLVLTGIFFAAQAVKLYSDCEIRSAQKLMFGSFIYLPVVQIIWMINKLF